jgi:hypothetical protein
LKATKWTQPDFGFTKSFSPFSHQVESHSHETSEFQKVQHHSELNAFPFAIAAQIFVIVMGSSGAVAGQFESDLRASARIVASREISFSLTTQEIAVCK